ncbi:hypothetical protein SCP_1005400 [Sparassis crispa]|uniref:Uncharacterized protein n=1 Tax=Sparassis crispa TaxID=139825 RepID=A0A401GYR0_9APHY|nr:hypothetical protein SCP_1005400 [Sparassis crispa]GBE87292.1 hypothetical protein SCP_1005400 [Sparassis crispa]
MPVPAARWTTRDTPRESVPPVLFGIGDVSGIPIGQPGLFARMQGAHDRVFEKTGLSSIRVVLTWFDGTQVEKAVNLIVKGLPVTREQLANQVSKLVGDFVLHKVVRDESPPELYLVALDPVQADIFRVEMHATLF